MEEIKNDEQLKKIKEKKIKSEQNRLKKVFKNLDEDRQKIAQKLIENASFMAVTLEELKEFIMINGVKERYDNGGNQSGYKESIETKNYNTMIKNYMTIIKQLNDMLPESKRLNSEDEFDKFNDL